jgi:hypothetical protein
MSKDTKTERRTIQVGDEHVPFDAIVGRNVPEREEKEEESR